MKSFTHTVEVNEEARTLRIYRRFLDGQLDILLETHLPEINAYEDWEKFEDLAKKLGENLLMDSPAARKILSL